MLLKLTLVSQCKFVPPLLLLFFPLSSSVFEVDEREKNIRLFKYLHPLFFFKKINLQARIGIEKKKNSDGNHFHTSNSPHGRYNYQFSTLHHSHFRPDNYLQLEVSCTLQDNLTTFLLLPELPPPPLLSFNHQGHYTV